MGETGTRLSNTNSQLQPVGCFLFSTGSESVEVNPPRKDADYFLPTEIHWASEPPKVPGTAPELFSAETPKLSFNVWIGGFSDPNHQLRVFLAKLGSG